ncbi:MAG: hypothetical protein ACFCU1_10360 [Sumerlaeia bacterium]
MAASTIATNPCKAQEVFRRIHPSGLLDYITQLQNTRTHFCRFGCFFAQNHQPSRRKKYVILCGVKSILDSCKKSAAIELLGANKYKVNLRSFSVSLFKVLLFFAIVILVFYGAYHLILWPKLTVLFGVLAVIVYFYLCFLFVRKCKYLWFRQAKGMLVIISEISVLLDLYHRRYILKDDDWFRGQEKSIKALCEQYELSEAYYEKLINQKA